MATDPAMTILPPYTPELYHKVHHRVQDFLLSRAPGRRKVLEYGSGWSTIWFALMGVDITSVEHDEGWATEVHRCFGNLRLKNQTLLTIPSKSFPDVGVVRKYDLIYVDCVDEMRPACIESAPEKLDAGGGILVDDSHWDLVRPSIERVIEKGFEREWTIGGMHVRKTGERKYHESTLLRRVS